MTVALIFHLHQEAPPLLYHPELEKKIPAEKVCHPEPVEGSVLPVFSQQPLN
jgi:hypothetical protein